MIRFNPFSDLKLACYINAFKPYDAQTLAACALVGCDAGFLSANFDALLMDGFLLLRDVRHQVSGRVHLLRVARHEHVRLPHALKKALHGREHGGNPLRNPTKWLRLA